jgi:carbon-monoxide dehydrogenase medium subunit
MEEFYRGPYETAVGQAEILVEVRLPVRPGGSSAYAKVDRRAGDWAVVAAGASIVIVDGGVAGDGLALAAVGGDITVAAAEAALIGERPGDAVFARAAELARSACEPISDQRGSADYKRHVVGVLTERVLRRATERALLMKEE